MVESLNGPKTPPPTKGDHSPVAGPFAEAAGCARELVRQGRLTPDKALKLTEQAYRDSMIAQLGGYPVEEGSTELPENHR